MEYYLQKNISRFGIILSRLAIVFLVIGIGLLFSQVLVILTYVILIAVGLLSLLTLFFNEDFQNLFNVTNSFSDFFSKAQTYFPTIMGISVALFVVGFICQLADYKSRSSHTELLLYGFCTLLTSVIFAVSMLGGYVNV